MPPNARPHAVPAALWVVVGVFAAAALITVISAFGAGILGVPILAIAVGLGLLASQMYRGSRLARALAVVTAGILLVLSLGTGWSVSWILVGLATAAVAPVLTLAPSIRAYFAGPFGRAPAAAVSVVTVQIVASVGGALTAIGTLLVLVLGLVAAGSGASLGSSGDVAGLVGGVLGMLGGLAVVIALFYGALAAFWLWAAVVLGRANRGARIAVTIVCGLDALPLFAMLPDAPGLALTSLLLHGAVVGALWLPTDARRHFRDPAPLPAVERAHWRAVACGASVAASISGATRPVPGPHRPMPSGPVPPSPPHGVRMPGPATPAPWRPAPPPASPTSVPVPTPRVDQDPLTEPLALGRHARRDPGPAGQPV